MSLTVSIPYLVGDADVRSPLPRALPVPRRVADAEPVMQRPIFAPRRVEDAPVDVSPWTVRRVADAAPAVSPWTVRRVADAAPAPMMPLVRRVNDDAPLSVRRVDEPSEPVRMLAPHFPRAPYVARRVPDAFCGCPPSKGPSKRTEKEKIEKIERATGEALCSTRKNRAIIDNVKLQLELATYAYGKGLFPPTFTPYALGRLAAITGNRDAALAAVFTSIQALEGTRGHGAVFQAGKDAIDRLAGESCSLKKDVTHLRRDIKALDRTAKKHQPCPCGCESAKAA